MILGKIGKMDTGLISACLSQRTVTEMLATDRSLIKGQILAPLYCEQIFQKCKADRHLSRDEEWSAEEPQA